MLERKRDVKGDEDNCGADFVVFDDTEMCEKGEAEARCELAREVSKEVEVMIAKEALRLDLTSVGVKCADGGRVVRRRNARTEEEAMESGGTQELGSGKGEEARIGDAGQQSG